MFRIARKPVRSAATTVEPQTTAVEDILQQLQARSSPSHINKQRQNILEAVKAIWPDHDTPGAAAVRVQLAATAILVCAPDLQINSSALAAKLADAVGSIRSHGILGTLSDWGMRRHDR